MHKQMLVIKNNIGKISFLVLFVILWQTLQTASTTSIENEYLKNRQIEVLSLVSSEIFKPGDRVFLSTQNSTLQKVINGLGNSVYYFDANDAARSETELIKVMDTYCSMGKEQENPATFFIWTQDTSQTAMELSSTVRKLNFFYSFQAVLPYEGSSAYAIDKVLRLIPKQNIINRYCEATKLSGYEQIIYIIDSNEFSPWIGSMKTGRITWLASEPTRKMKISDFVVKDMPPLLGYDVYWVGTLEKGYSWTFENQDMAAFDQTVKLAKKQNSIFLIDRNTVFGNTAQRFFTECNGVSLVDSKLFRQICMK
jgi:hypothetical protein